jgi:hypothetical protein
MASFVKLATSTLPLSLLLFSQMTSAAPGMSEQQMQMMQQAQECFSKLDQSKFGELEAKGKKMEAEIKALCKAGKRDKAMSTAMKYSKEMNDDPQLKAMRKCSEQMKGMMGDMPGSSFGSSSSTKQQKKEAHICDDM